MKNKQYQTVDSKIKYQNQRKEKRHRNAWPLSFLA